MARVPRRRYTPSHSVSPGAEAGATCRGSGNEGIIIGRSLCVKYIHTTETQKPGRGKAKGDQWTSESRSSRSSLPAEFYIERACLHRAASQFPRGPDPAREMRPGAGREWNALKASLLFKASALVIQGFASPTVATSLKPLELSIRYLCGEKR